jgi:hypothetical protein
MASEHGYSTMAQELRQARRVVVFSRSGSVEFRRSPDGETHVDGRIVEAEGGMYVQGKEAVLVGFEGGARIAPRL